MTWQRPPQDPGREYMWPGGYKRVLGAVSDGVTKTYGLREVSAAHLVLFDGVIVPSSAYRINRSAQAIYFEYVPPSRGWIEVLGSGPSETFPVPNSTTYLTYDRAVVEDALKTREPVVLPKFLVEQATLEFAHSTNGGVTAPDGKGYFIPSDEYDILRIDRGWERVRVRTLDLYSYAKYAGALLGPNMKIYGAPDTASAIMEYTPETETGRYIPITPVKGDHVWSTDMFLGGVEVGGIVYGVPFDADFFYRIEANASRVTHPTYGLDLRYPGKWCGCVRHEGVGYAIPYNASTILRIRPGDVVDEIPITTSNPEYAAKWRGGCVYEGVLYCAPFEAQYVLAVDLATMDMRELTFGADLDRRFKYWGCAGTQGKLVFAPYDLDTVLIADIAANTSYETSFGMMDDVKEPLAKFAGAYADGVGRVHLLRACGHVGFVVDPVNNYGYVRKTTDRDIGGGAPSQYLEGAKEDNGLIHYNPYNADGVHWTLDTTQYAVDHISSGATGDREAAGVRDFGDHVWIMHDSGDLYQYRLSGLKWGEEAQIYAYYSEFKPYLPPRVKDPKHFPTFMWGRTKAFFNMINVWGSDYGVPSSQSYFIRYDDEPKKVTVAEEFPLLGYSRDQFWNGSVQGEDGKIYGIPYNGTHVSILDIYTELVDLKDYGLDLLGRRKWYGGVRSGSKIYGIPFDAPGVLIIDTSTGTAEIRDYGLNLSGRRKYMSAVRRDNTVVFIPCDADRFLVINTDYDTAQLVTYGFSQAVLSEKLKWGAAVVNANKDIVCGPLGAPSSDNLMGFTRNPAWITEYGQGNLVTAKYRGCGAGSFTMPDGTMFFRRKSEFGSNTSTDGGPIRIPSVMSASAVFPNMLRAPTYGWNTDCIYTIDHWVYTMTEGRDGRFSVELADWSTYNSVYDAVPGLRPWVGLPPAAFVQYDPDELAMYPLNELKAYRKSACWNDPHYTTNNTSYGVPCNGGVFTRNTAQQYNHFREYIRDANNFERIWWGSIEDDSGNIYAVPYSLPIVTSINTSTNVVDRFRIEIPPGWDGSTLWKDGTYYEGKLVFFPRGVLFFSYCDPVTHAIEHVPLPAPHNVRDGWRAWVRVGDEVLGFPYNADYILVWNLATRTATTREMPSETLPWANNLWSDAVVLPLSESSPERDPAFLLPYNDERVGVMYPRRRAAGYALDFDHFEARFPGQRKWSCWTTSKANGVQRTLWGIPCDHSKVLVCDVCGAEPTLDDFGIELDWQREGKWMSVAEFVLKDQSLHQDTTFALTVPYNAEEMLAFFHDTGRVVKVNYTGPSLVGEKKWWGAGVAGKVAYFVPYNAEGVLAVTVEVTAVNDELVVNAVGHLMTFDLDMVGEGKWRGAAEFGTQLVMVAYNRDRFLVLSAPDAEDPSRTTAKLDLLGIPVGYMTSSAKWAPQHTYALQNVDLRATREYSFPAETHEYTLRIANHASQVQCWMVPHEEAVGHRGWRSVRSPLNIPERYYYAPTFPWSTNSFLTIDGSKVGKHMGGYNWQALGKFAAAILDGRGGVICIPDNGMQFFHYDLAREEGKWITQSNALDNAPGDCVEFAYKSPGGKIYSFVRKETRNGADIAWFQPERPAYALGDGFTIDYAMEYRDTKSYWPRWGSFSRMNSAARWEDICGGANCIPATPIRVNTEHRYHGAIAVGDKAMALIPSGTGQLVYYSKYGGREGYSRREAQFTVHEGGIAPYKPATFYPAARNDKLFLLPTAVHNPYALSTCRSDPVYEHIVDPETGEIEHTEVARVWRDAAALALKPVHIGDVTFMFTAREGYDPDGIRTGTFIYKVDAAGAWEAVPLQTRAPKSVPDVDWVPRAFTRTDGSHLVFSASHPDIVHIGADLAVSYYEVDKTRFSFVGHGIAGAAASSGHIYSVAAAYEVSKLEPDKARTLITVIDNNTDVNSYLEFSEEFVTESLGTATIGYAIYFGGKIYVPMDGVPGMLTGDIRRMTRLYYLEIDPVAKTIEINNTEGVPTGFTRGGFTWEDGSIWFERIVNNDQRKYIRFDTETKEVSEPVDDRALVAADYGRGAAITVPWYSGAPVRLGAKMYMTPYRTASRSTIVYELDPVNNTFIPSGYTMACKDSHKWNGWAYDEHRYAYAAPFNADTVLRLDFLDPANPVAECIRVERYPGAAAYAHTTDNLSQVLHNSGGAENLSRGVTSNKFGTTWTTPYGGRNAQFIEIRKNGKSRLRLPGPDYLSERKWMDAAIAPNGRIYGAPFDSDEVFTLDPDLDKAGTSFANMPEGLEGKGKYSIVIPTDGEVWMLPFNARNALVVDYASQWFRTETPATVNFDEDGKWLGYCALTGDRDNLVYCAPYDVDRVLKFDKDTKEFTELPLDYGEGLGKWCCLVEAGDMLFAAPFNADDMLAVDLLTDTAYRFSPGLDMFGEDTWAVSAMGEDGNVIMAGGGKSDVFLRLKFEDDVIWGSFVEFYDVPPECNNRFGAMCWHESITTDGELIRTFLAGPADAVVPVMADEGVVRDGVYTGDDKASMEGKWRGGETSVTGDLLLMPYNHEKAAKVTGDGDLSLVEVGLWIAGEGNWADLAIVDGIVYMPPYNHDLWLTYNAETFYGGLYTFGAIIPAGEERWSLAVVRNKVVYGIPYNASVFAVLNAETNTLIHDTQGLPGSALTGDGKWWGTCVTEDSANLFPPYNASTVLRLSESAVFSMATMRVRYNVDNAFSGAVKVGTDRVYIPAAYHLPVVESTTAKPDRMGLPMNILTSGQKFGGGVVVAADKVLLYPGSGAPGLMTRDIDGRYSVEMLTANFTSTVATDPRFVSSVERDGKFYLIPYSTNGYGIYNPTTSTLDSRYGTVGPRQYVGAYIAHDGAIMCVPHNATRVLRIAANDSYTYTTPVGVNLSGDGKWWGCATAGGSTYFVPYNSDKVVVVDAAGVYTETDYGLNLAGQEKWRGAVVRGDFVIMLPYNHSEFLAIDTVNGTAYFFTDMSATLGGRRYGSFVEDGTAVYMPPDRGDQAIRILFNTAGGVPSATVIKTNSAVEFVGEGKFKAAVSAGSVATFLPYNYGVFVNYDIVEGTCTLRTLIRNNALVEKIRDGVYSADGKLYMTSDVGIYVVDPLAWTVLGYTPQASLNGLAVVEDEVYVLCGSSYYRYFPDGTYTIGAFTGVTQTVPTAQPFMRLKYIDGKVYGATYDARLLLAATHPPIDPSLHAVKVDTTGLEKWCTAVPAGMGSHFAAPYADDRVFYNDGAAAWVVMLPNLFTGTKRWRGGVYYNDILYAAPYNAEAVGVYDHATMEFTEELFDAELHLVGDAKWEFGFVHGEEIFFMPSHSQNILVIRPDNKTSRVIPFGFPVLTSEGKQRWGAWVMRDGKCYGIPYNDPDLVEFDPVTEETRIRTVSMDLSGEEKWACGRLLADKRHIVYLPWLHEKALVLDADTRKAKLSWLKSREFMSILKPIWGTCYWEDNPRLTDGELDEEDMDAEADTGALSEYFVFSSLDGAARFDINTGEITTNPVKWGAEESVPYDTFLGFAYSFESARVYGVPHNARSVLQVYSNGAGPIVGKHIMTPSVTPRFQDNERTTIDGTSKWRIFHDLFSCSISVPSGWTLWGAGSSLIMLQIEPFSGITYATDMDVFQGWERPIEIIPVSGGAPIITDHNRYELRDRVHGTAVLGLDGLAYFFPLIGNFGMAWSSGDIADKVCMPLRRAITSESDESVGLFFEYTLWTGQPYASSTTGLSGVIYAGGGQDVSAGRINTSIGNDGSSQKPTGFDSTTWFEGGGYRHTDRNGVVSERKPYRLVSVDTGVWSVSNLLYYASPLYKGT